MLLVIGLLIVSILLFGAGRVIGAFGYVAGFIAFAAAIAVLSYYLVKWFDLSTEQAMAWVLGVPLFIIAAGNLAMQIWGDKPNK